MNNRDYAPRRSEPSYQSSFNQVGQGNCSSRERGGFFQGDQRPPEQRDIRGDHRNIVPSQGGNYGQGPSSGYGQNFGQGSNPGYGQNFGQRANPDYQQNSVLGANPGYGQSYGQGSNHGFDQNNRPGAMAGSWQRANPGYGQTYPGHGVGQGFSQAEQRIVQAEATGSMGRGGMQQGKD